MTTEKLLTFNSIGSLVFKQTTKEKKYSYQFYTLSLPNSSSTTFYDIKRVFICKLFLMKYSISNAANLFKGKTNVLFRCIAFLMKA